MASSASSLLLPDIPLERYKLLQILQAIGDAVVVFTPDGSVLLANTAFEKLIHQDAPNMAGRSLEELFAELAPELPALLKDAVTLGERTTHEWKLYLGHQKRTYLLDLIPIMDMGTITEGVAVFHDITQQKQTEKMRRDFVANVSHELRTPLSAINGYAETLLEGALQDKNVAEEFVQIIFNHSQRLSQLVRDLLDLSKLESEECPFELAPMPLKPMVDKVLSLSQKSLREKSIDLHYAPPEGLPDVIAHDSTMEQVLTNLLDNAIKYTPAGGTIRIHLSVQGDMLQVDIEDTGIGIEAKHIPRLFERFYRVDKARSRDLGGTGLGLSIVKHIIQYHGGDVWVNSEPGKGSTFSFNLKLA